MLPKWMRRAIKEQVISEPEALELHRLSMESELEEVKLPEHLWPAAERIYLWEMPVESMAQ